MDADVNKSGTMVDTEHLGLKKRKIGVATIVFMIYCLLLGRCVRHRGNDLLRRPRSHADHADGAPLRMGNPSGARGCRTGLRQTAGGRVITSGCQEALGEFWGFQGRLVEDSIRLYR